MATKREKNYDDDRLSELSDDLIEKIMSLLSPVESAKLSNLSKRLSSAWLSSPEPQRLCLVDKVLLIIRNLGTLTITNQCSLNTRPFPVAVFSTCWITSLSLEYLRFPHRELLVVDSPLLRHFRLQLCRGLAGVRLSGAVQKVSVFHCVGLTRLHLDGKGDLRDLSYSTFDRGDHCRIDFNAASQNSLTALRMNQVGIVSDDWLRDNVSKFLSLETLKLINCSKLTSLHLDDQNSKSLKHLTFEWSSHYCSLNVAVSVSVSVSGLESLTLCGYLIKQPRTLDFHKCISLRSLKIVNVDITPLMIEANLNSNPFLDDITLQNCYVSANGVIKSSETMVVTWHNLKINHLFTNMVDVPDSRSYERYWNFLDLFGHRNTLQFEVGNGKRFMFPKSLRDTLMPPLCEVKNLELKIGSLFDISSIVELVDAFLWLAPRLSVVSLCLDNSIFMIKFYYAAEQDVSDRTRCCSNAPMTCWRHGLTEVVIESLKDDEIKEKLLNYFVINVDAEVKIDYRG